MTDEPFDRSFLTRPPNGVKLWIADRLKHMPFIGFAASADGSRKMVYLDDVYKALEIEEGE